MKSSIQTTILCIAVASVAIAATSRTKRLTPQRIAELTAVSGSPKPERYSVAISGLDSPGPLGRPVPAPAPSTTRGSASISFPAEKPEAVLEFIREFRFPSRFEPPHTGADGVSLIKPPTPAAFESVNTGWSIRLSAKQQGNLVAIAGAAAYTAAEFVPGDYGPLSGPIYSEDGKLISPNVYHQPKIETTTTHFHIFAVPGEPYEVTFYHGTKSEKHTITVTTD